MHTVAEQLKHLDNLELQNLQPSREKFGNDPFGYAGCAWVQYVLAAELSGVTDCPDPNNPPKSDDLKRPALWFSQSQALMFAGFKLLELEPEYLDCPISLRGMRDSQFRATALMLIGYSLEVTLKGTTILKQGIDVYTEREKNRETFTHDLVKLADFIPELTEKDKAILGQFKNFLTWAGRYPDPGFKFINSAEDIHKVSEKHEITMGDVVKLMGKVMQYVNAVLDSKEVSETGMPLSTEDN